MSDATSVEATTAKGLPNTQPNDMPATFPVEFFHSGNPAGVLVVPQHDTLSKENGNVLYRGGIKKGLRFNEDIDLAGFTILVNGVEALISSNGVHLKAPSVYRKGPKAGQVVPNTGGQLMVTYCARIDLGGRVHNVNVIITRLHPKGGKPQGFSIAIAANPSGEGFAAGPVVVGEATGFVIEEV